LKKQANTHIRYQVIFSLLIVGALLLPQAGFAASTTTPLRQIGRSAATESGDYISSGLHQPYRYYIEVPPGLANLYVDIYDADIGAVTIAGNYTDWLIGALPYNTSCIYTLNRPNGTLEYSATYNNTQTAADSTWINFRTVSSPAPGHWELVVDMSATGNGNDVNGYGIRAHDGTSGAGGTELPIYAESFLPLGHVGASPSSATTTFYPYVTSGCTVDWNDFDGDDDGTGTYCLLSYTSRAGAVPYTTYHGAANDVWVNTAISGYSTDSLNIDSGIWTATARYRTLSGSTANFGVFWAGNWLAATGTPSAQPEDDSFRVYLPTDSGGAPIKPYLTQRIVIVSGPNPPISGGTTYIRVVIDFVNPTARAVTFSASTTPADLVTARVPGGRVRYRGAAYAAVSQGSITDQPGDLQNAADNVTWDPGTVAAGATATLYYELRVRPSANNQYNNATGTPDANGTTARYVDETGNTTQTRATFTFGPLCELSTYSGTGGDIPTWVAVSCFEACSEENQPTVEWHTASEVGTVGFNLWRQDKGSKEFQLVNPSFLPAIPNSPQGGVYRLADPGAQFNEPVIYRLEEIDALGRTMSYGPFTVTFGAQSWQLDTENMPEKKGKEEPTDIYGYQRFNRERSVYELERLHARFLDRQAGAAQDASQSKERVRITVKGRGLFYVNSSQIASSLGVSLQKSQALIRGQKLNLTNLGKNIAWLADSNGAGIFFYNDLVETSYTEQNVFWLDQSSGLAMDTIGGGNAGPADPSQSFRETLHFEENHYAAAALFSNPKDDIWLWDYVEGGGSAKSFPVIVPGATSSGPASLVVTLKGATDTTASNDHHAKISLNGTEIGDTWWNGTKAQKFTVSFNSSLLKDGANTISISGALDMGAPYSLFYLESFDLSYQRQYKAYGNTLLCRGDGNSVITVAGFTEPQVVVLDVSKPERTKQITGVAPDVGGRVTFVPRAAANNYIVTTPNAALRPLAVKGDMPAQLKNSGRSAEYLVITPEEFKNTARKLADYRKSKGLTAMVVTLEDIYESFNYGLASPLAVRDFLAYVYHGSGKWGVKKVQYAVLIGKGTYDFKDYLGLGDNLFPVILANTPEGLFAADKEFGDLTGKDGIPEIAIGRLPVISNAELQSMIDKLKTYEKSRGAWTDIALMIADNADDGGDFAVSSNNLAALTAGYQVQKIYLADSAHAGEIRARIIAGFNSGAGLVNYVGHGGLDQLAQENILNVADATRLRNGGQLPLMVMLTCVTGRFEIPGVVCLSEALLLNKNGGIAGGLAPSGAALNADSMRLGQEFYKAVFRGQETSAGMAWLKAMKNYMRLAGKSYMLNIYNWLGDPALIFK
jgi:hypothetical protein